jgi:hypothetical protein
MKKTFEGLSFSDFYITEGYTMLYIGNDELLKQLDDMDEDKIDDESTKLHMLISSKVIPLSKMLKEIGIKNERKKIKITIEVED